MRTTAASRSAIRAIAMAGRSGLPRRTVLLGRRLSGAAVAAFLLVGGLVFGAVAPAAADPPEIRFENLCGAVDFDWDTGTIGGAETWATTVLRNGGVIAEFEMRDRGGATYGARDGDVFEIHRVGLPARDFVHRSPDGCTDAPMLTVTATSECSGLVLTFSNDADAPVTGLQVLLPGTGHRDVDPVGPGRTELLLELADGAGFQVRGPIVGGGWASWLAGGYHQPAGCVTPTPSVPSVTVSPSAPGGTGSPIGASPGSGDPGSGDPGSGDPGSGDPGSGDPGVGAGLPVTGAQTAIVSLAGVALIGAGVVLFLVTRRRRLRFTAGNVR